MSGTSGIKHPSLIELQAIWAQGAVQAILDNEVRSLQEGMRSCKEAASQAIVTAQLNTVERECYDQIILPQGRILNPGDLNFGKEALRILSLILRSPLYCSLSDVFPILFGKRLEVLGLQERRVSIANFFELLNTAVLVTPGIHPMWILRLFSDQENVFQEAGLLDMLRLFIMLNPENVSHLNCALQDYIAQKGLAGDTTEFFHHWLAQQCRVSRLSLENQPFEYLSINVFRVGVEACSQGRPFFTSVYVQLQPILQELVMRFFHPKPSYQKMVLKEVLAKLLIDTLCSQEDLFQSLLDFGQARARLEGKDAATSGAVCVGKAPPEIDFLPLLLGGFQALVARFHAKPVFNVDPGAIRALGHCYLQKQAHRLLTEPSLDDERLCSELGLLVRTLVKVFSGNLTVSDWAAFKDVLAQAAQFDGAWMIHQAILSILESLPFQSIHVSIQEEVEAITAQLRGDLECSINWRNDDIRGYSVYQRLLVTQALQEQLLIPMPGGKRLLPRTLTRKQVDQMQELIRLYFSLRDYRSACAILEYYLFKSHPLHGMGLESFHDLWRTVVEKLIHVAESEEGLTDYFSPHDGEPSLYSAGVQGKSLQALFESLRNQVAETTEAPYILLLLTRYHHAILQIHALKKELHGLTEVIKNREDIVKSQESCLLAEQLFPRGQKTSREKLASLKTAIKHSKRGVVAVQTESKKVSSLIRKGEEDLATFRCGMQELSDFQQEDFNSKPSKSKSRLSKSKKESSAELELQCLRPTTASLFFNSSEKQGAAAVSARDTAHLHAD